MCLYVQLIILAGAGTFVARGAQVRRIGQMPPVYYPSYEANSSRPVRNIDWDNHFVPLWPDGEVPGPVDGSVPERFEMANSDDDPIGRRCCPGDNSGRWFRQVSVPALRAFLVKKPETRTDAAVILIPGGGCEFLAWTKEGVDVARWLNSFGVHAFVLKYRVPCIKDSHFYDGQRAVKLVRYHAHSLGIDPDKVGVMGFSAGGYLAGFVATHAPMLYPAVDVADSVPSRPDFLLAVYAGFHDDEDSRNAPMTFIVVTDNDQCVDSRDSIRFYKARNSSDLKTELHIFADGRHGYGMCRMYPDTDYGVCRWPRAARRWLEAEVLHSGAYPPNPRAAELRAEDRAHPPGPEEE